MPDLDTFDFAALGQQALAMADSVAGTPATPPAPASPVAQPPSTPTAASGTAQPIDAGQPTPTAPPETIDVSFGNGRVEKLTVAQIQQKLLESEANGLRQADYTRKTTELARQRQEAQQAIQQAVAVQQELAHYRQILNNPQLLQQQQQQQQMLQQPMDPNQVMTVGQGQAIANAMAQQLHAVQQAQQIIPQTVQQMAAQLVDDRLQVANFAESINSTLNDIWKEHPILTAAPQNEDILRYEVARMQPQTVDEARVLFKDLAKQMADNYESKFNARQQEQTAAKVKMTAGGIEPPGGAAPQPAKPSFRTQTGGLDWDKLRTAAIGMAG